MILVQATITHAQFETIHPFPDGNGRTGRALLHSLLRAKRLTRTVTVPVSAELLTNTDAYFATLTAYREGEPTTIVELIADASFRAIDNGRALATDLATIRAGWNERITARRRASAHRLADLLVRRPVVDSPLVQRELDVAATNANTGIGHLEDKGILTMVSGNYRNRKWAAPRAPCSTTPARPGSEAIGRRPPCRGPSSPTGSITSVPSTALTR